MPKISLLTAATALSDDDLLVVVDAPGGTPGTRRITALNAAGYFGGARRTLNAQTGTSYAPVVADENTMVTLSNAAAITVTLPSNATQAFTIGAEVEFLWLGVGQPSFAAGSGATVVNMGSPRIAERYGVVKAKKIATDDWLLYGALADTTYPLVTKSTTPTATDYGLATIPTGAVWIQSP